MLSSAGKRGGRIVGGPGNTQKVRLGRSHFWSCSQRVGTRAKVNRGDMGAARAILIVISMVLMVNQASARNGFGAGGHSCGTWLETRQNQDAARVGRESWVLGYVSGANSSKDGDDFLVEPDAQAIFAWLDNYCRQHPLERLVKASSMLIDELKMRAAAAETKRK
jgi:hypothetical protein